MVWLIVGLAVGVAGEQVVDRVSDRPARRPARSGAPGEPRAPRGRCRLALICAGAAALLLVVGLGLWIWANALFGRIDRVAAGPALRHGGGNGKNYLLVGTDNRAGITGNRSDTIIVLRIESGRGRMLSIPRDLYVKIASTGRKARINSAYAGGAANLVRTIDADLGLPIDRYLEVNFASFGPLVDAIGGVDIDFANPAFDQASGLDVKQSGRIHLDGAQALAFVRSRHYVEVVNGTQTPDLTSDIGREQRQQTFLRAVLGKAGHTRNPLRLMKVASALSKGIRIDDAMSIWDAVALGRNAGRLDPGTEKLPTTPVTLGNGAQVLSLKQPDAEAVLARFR